jgi:hypothetical protein
MKHRWFGALEHYGEPASDGNSRAATQDAENGRIRRIDGRARRAISVGTQIAPRRNYIADRFRGLAERAGV